MRKLLMIISLAGIAALQACNNKAKENAKEQALIRMRIEKAVRDSLKLDSFKKADSIEQAQLIRQKEQSGDKRIDPQYAPGATNNSKSSQAQAHQKKGWSSAAKGAVIGGVGGAIGGAIIGKGKGAVIGAAAGAGAGYAIGRSKDRKSGRVRPKKHQ